MNLPIALTLFRIVLVPLIMVFLISSSRVSVLIAAVIFVAASLTDWLDGRMARRWNQVTRLGTLLDDDRGVLRLGDLHQQVRQAVRAALLGEAALVLLGLSHLQRQIDK